MPPRPIEKPEFSIYGRYLLNVDERKTPGTTYFHDTEYLQDKCGVQSVPSGSLSRFNNKVWATSRGFVQCNHCEST